jgi:hypothetical protein
MSRGPGNVLLVSILSNIFRAVPEPNNSILPSPFPNSSSMTSPGVFSSCHLERIPGATQPA